MMKYSSKIVSFIVILFCSISAISQGSFQFIISSNLDDRIFDLTELSDGSFIAVGSRGQYGGNNSSYSGIIYEISEGGDTVGHYYSKNDTATVFYKIIPDSLFGFVILGSIATAPDYNEQLMIGIIDQQFNISIQNCISMNEYEKILSIDYLKDNSGYYISTGVKDDQSNYKHFNLSHLSISGDSISSKTFDTLGNAIIISDILFSKNNNEIWVFGSGFGTTNASRIRIDSAFNVISSQSIQDFIAYPHLNAQWFSDSTLLFGGKYIHQGSSPQDDDIGICITDTSFNNLDIHCFGSIDTLDYPAWERFIDFHNQDTIFFAGTHNVIIDFFPQESSWIMIGQLDQYLNKRNIVYYGGDAYYKTMNILATNDGGCLVAALRYDYLTQLHEHDVLILKLKKEDIITSLNEVQIQSNAKIVVYPNPGQDLINVRVSNSGLIFSLYDNTGKLIFHIRLIEGLTSINTSYLLPGIYFYTLLSPEGRVEKGKWIKNN